jgi:polar amino acid transport system substrate-binding protein
MNKLIIVSLSFVVLVFGFYLFRKQYQPKPSAMPIEIVVGTSADFKPFSFIDHDVITGFDIDIINEIAQRLALKITIKNMPFELLIPQIQLGRIHVVAAGLSKTPEREKHMLMTRAYLVNDPLVIVVKSLSPELNKIADLQGKKVVVNQGYTADTYMSKIDGINLIRLATVADAVLALESNQADAFVTASSTIQPLMEQYGMTSFKTAMIPDANENLVFGISQDYPELASKIDSTLGDLQADGTLEKLKQKWHVQ